MGPGDVLFSMFGHAAICVTGESLPGGGLCYNYGTSDFSRPIGLAWDVVRGRAEFWVSISDLTSMLLSFESDDRTIYRQVLPLDPEQVARLSETLYRDGSAENRVYIYNHYLENCSTRPRDHIDEVTGGALREASVPHGSTFREQALEGLGAAHWILVPATDLVMGRWSDQRIDTFEAMFFPRILRLAVEEKLGARPEIVYERRAPTARADVASARLRLWVIVASLAILHLGLARFRRERLFGAIVLGGLGLLLGFAAVVSVLPELRINELLLVFLPTDVFLASTSARVVSYARARLVLLAAVALLALAGIFIQPLWPFWALAVSFLAVRARPTPVSS